METRNGFLRNSTMDRQNSIRADFRGLGKKDMVKGLLW